MCSTKQKKDEKIKYYDITSLYPYVQKTCKFPVGMPQIIKKDFINIDALNRKWHYEGIANIRILPPNDLFHPVLPSRLANGKLVFTLCRSCASELNVKTPCEHSVRERSLTGVYCTPEIELALEKGYKILKVFEVWHFQASKVWDGVHEDTGLFTKYVQSLITVLNSL